MDNKVVLITGSSSGIGEEAAIHFASLGAKVVITGRRADAVNQVAEKCREVSPHHHKFLAVIADVNVDEEVKNLLEKVIKAHGRLDVLVNNAGFGSFTAIDDPNLMASYDSMMKTNVRSLLYLTQLAVPHLERSKGCIVNVSSLVSLRPVEKWTVYCMTKAAVDMMTNCLALELGPKGIRVNSVNPGYVRTNFQSRMGFESEADLNFRKFMESAYPLRRYGIASDVVKAIVFLASSDASFITGCQLNIDGGARYGQLVPPGI